MAKEQESYRVIVIGEFDNEAISILIKNCENVKKGKIELRLTDKFPKDSELYSARYPIHIMMIDVSHYKRYVKETFDFSKQNPVVILHSNPDFLCLDKKNIDQAFISKEEKKLVGHDSYLRSN